MSSKILVDEIAPKTTSGIVKGASNVLEVLPMLCDGGSYVVPSGTYTPTNVTALTNLTTSYVTLPGSEISYTPPSGTICVIYDFTFLFSYSSAHAISHYRFYIDSDEVTNQRLNVSGQYPEVIQNLKYVIPIGGSANTATGRQATWTSAKTLKITVREYGSSNQGTVHSTVYFDGGGAATFHQPSLTITSIGAAYNG